MTDATGTTSWYYGADGVHLAQLASPQGTLTYVYDGDGRLSYKYVNVTNVGVVSTWYNAYDAGGRLTSLRSTLDGTTTFAYDAASRLTQKTKGSGDYELYAYDSADQMTSIGYWFVGGTMQNAQTYSYTPGGSVQTMNQGWYSTTYAYDGANQLVSETGAGGYNSSGSPNRGFTYDHNGNRLTQSVNGSQVQSFGYDAHDKLVSGTAGSETDTYDLNGSLLTLILSGQSSSRTYDEEDRLTRLTITNGPTDTFVYNGLGLRVGKTDSAGSYSYMCDGASPGSPVLSDGHALYTPGLSENRGGVAAYYSNDRLGNLWTLDGSSQNQLSYIDFSGFGGVLAEAGSGSVFGYGGGNGCQSDVDTGLVLMGHRYYDPRIGRFLSQDPAGDGDNWYQYCDNDPMNSVDPMGLMPIMSFPEGSMPQGTDQPIWASAESAAMEQFGTVWHKFTDGTSSPYNTPGVTYVNPGYYWAPVSNLGDWVDQNVTFGLVTNAGNVAGAYDSGKASRGAAIGTGALAVGVIVATGLTEGKDVEGETLVTHWGSEEELAEIAANGFKKGMWVMKGKANPVKYIMTAVFHKYPYSSRITTLVRSSSLTQEGVDVVQKLLLHWRIGP